MQVESIVFIVRFLYGMSLLDVYINHSLAALPVIMMGHNRKDRVPRVLCLILQCKTRRLRFDGKRFFQPTGCVCLSMLLLFPYFIVTWQISIPYACVNI